LAISLGKKLEFHSKQVHWIRIVSKQMDENRRRSSQLGGIGPACEGKLVKLEPCAGWITDPSLSRRAAAPFVICSVSFLSTNG
jgi:hypothetical protein